MKLKLINHSGNVVLGLIVAVVATGLVVGGLVYSWQKKQGDTKIQEAQKQIQEKDNKVSDLENQLAERQKEIEEITMPDKNSTQEWSSYTSANYNLSFLYPKGWSINDSLGNKEEVGSFMGIGLTPPTMSGDFQWVITTYSTKGASIDSLISEAGKQFSDRQVQRQEITLSGLPATKAVITSAKAAATTPTWYYELVFVKRGSEIVVIGNGAIKDDNFQTFYSSIQFK